MSEEIKPLKIYIGWDSREDIAYQVARQSIIDHATVPVDIQPIKLRTLQKNKDYWRSDDPLSSTEFTFSRFLVPYLNDYEDWALFIDCDFLFLDDVKKLFDQIDNKYAIMCAQHDYTPKEGVKMDGKKQTVYPRKNWSSMMLINCGHKKNSVLTPDVISNQHTTGAWLHRFTWLQNKEVGKISHEWNWLVNWYHEPDDGSPKALHYTEGGPWFEDYKHCEYASYWLHVKNNIAESKIKSLENHIQKINNKIYTIKDLDLPEDKKYYLKLLENYAIDPDGNYYPQPEPFEKITEKLMANKVATIDSDGGINYKDKGHAYDTYLASFALGSGGVLSNFEKEASTDRPLVIRGLGGGSRKAIQHCWDTGRTFYAIDTGYFGNGKVKRIHRITKNNLQHLGPVVERPGDRLHGYKFKKFYNGSKILICPPSQKVMELWGQPNPQQWVENVVAELKKHTDRPIEIRLKPTRTDRVTNNTIEEALADDVHCLITYNSIAATEALMNGKPAIALGPNAAQAICNTQLADVENLYIPDKDEMYAFVCHLSYCQFTQKEMQNGFAWTIVNESS